MRIRLITILMILAVLPMGVSAQKKKAKKTVKTVQVVKEEVEEVNINFENLLPSTAKIVFVDSQVVDRNAFASKISLSPSSGLFEVAKKNGKTTYSHTNSLSNSRIVSYQDAKGNYGLYRETRKGTEWGQPEKLDIPGGFTDLICPYMMADGTTLYFAAKGGEDNVGEYDIFFTIYDPDEQKFITPQSMGLPFNSPEDDLCYVIDEDSNIGYLVTSRRQENNKVCVYTFIPTEARESYDIEDEEELRRYASLSSIKMTQTNAKKELADAKVRLANVRNLKEVSTQGVALVVKPGVVYTKREDFKKEECKALYDKYCELSHKLTTNETILASKRVGYHKGQKYVANEILALEKEVENQRAELRKLKSEIINNLR